MAYVAVRPDLAVFADDDDAFHVDAGKYDGIFTEYEYAVVCDIFADSAEDHVLSDEAQAVLVDRKDVPWITYPERF